MTDGLCCDCEVTMDLNDCQRKRFKYRDEKKQKNSFLHWSSIDLHLNLIEKENCYCESDRIIAWDADRSCWRRRKGLLLLLRLIQNWKQMLNLSLFSSSSPPLLAAQILHRSCCQLKKVERSFPVSICSLIRRHLLFLHFLLLYQVCVARWNEIWSELSSRISSVNVRVLSFLNQSVTFVSFWYVHCLRSNLVDKEHNDLGINGGESRERDNAQ